MNSAYTAAALALCLFLGIVICLDIGFRVGRRVNGGVHEGISALDQPEARIDVYRDLSEPAATRAGRSESADRLLLPSLNSMIEITTTRTVALRTHISGHDPLPACNQGDARRRPGRSCDVQEAEQPMSELPDLMR